MMRLKEFCCRAIMISTLLVPGRVWGMDDTAEEETDLPPTSYGSDSVNAKAVGITGGAILGAEAVIAVQAAVGVDKVWPYFVFPVIGGAGGGVGGYYLEKVSTPGSVAMLVTGVALLIPTAVLAASAFAYDPEKDGAVMSDGMESDKFSFELPPDEEDFSGDYESEAVTDVERRPDVGPPGNAAPTTPAPAEEQEAPETPDDDGSDASPTGMRRSNRERHRVAISGSLLHVDRAGGFGVSVPFVDVRPVALLSERLRPNGTPERNWGVELHIPLLRVDLP